MIPLNPYLKSFRNSLYEGMYLKICTKSYSLDRKSPILLYRKIFFLMGHWSKGWVKKILNGVIGIWNSRLGVLQVYGHEIMGSNVQMYRFFPSFFCWHCIEKKNNFIVICFILYVRRVVSICFLCTNKRKLYFLSDFFIVFYLSEEELKVFNIIGQMCTFFLKIPSRGMYL